MNCKDVICKDWYPYYGLAPHGHDLAKTGSFIGSTVVKNKNEWPDNFIEDPAEPGMGTWVCPKCFNNMKPTDDKESGD